MIRCLTMIAQVLLVSASSAQTSGYKYLLRMPLGGPRECMQVYDWKQGLELENKIQIRVGDNNDCARTERCRVALGDLITLELNKNKQEELPGHYVLRHYDSHMEELVEVDMRVIKPDNGVRFLVGEKRLIRPGRYYLLYEGSCTDGRNCERFKFEIFPDAKSGSKHLPPDAPAKTQDSTQIDWSDQSCFGPEPRQPGGGSGEDPPTDPD